jgi:hypothetical protein
MPNNENNQKFLRGVQGGGFYKKSPPGRRRQKFSFEELDRELIARGAEIPAAARFKFSDKEGTPERDAIIARVKELYNTPPPRNEKLRHIGTAELVKMLSQRSRGRKVEDINKRAILGSDDRMDVYEIEEIEKIKRMDRMGKTRGIEDIEKIEQEYAKIEKIKANANCTAAIFLKEDLIRDRERFSRLKLKNYGEAFNLCDCEPFVHQPIAEGPHCSGFLVTKDIIATAGHFVNQWGLTDLCIVFGFRMLNPYTPVTRVSDKDIYKGTKIICQDYNPMNGSDWALVQLDRQVKDRQVAALSKNDVVCHQPVYVYGHPMGLPLKFAAGACVRDNTNKTYFAADLDIYMGNSGSPVFDSETHQVIGMVVRGYQKDFRLVENCLVSVIYPNPGIHSEGAHCTRVSEFRNIVAGTGDRCRWRRPSGK